MEVTLITKILLAVVVLNLLVSDQIANICWIIEKARVPEKHLFLLY